MSPFVYMYIYTHTHSAIPLKPAKYGTVTGLQFQAKSAHLRGRTEQGPVPSKVSAVLIKDPEGNQPEGRESGRPCPEITTSSEPETRLDLGGPPVDAVLRMLASLLSAVGAAEPL